MRSSNSERGGPELEGPAQGYVLKNRHGKKGPPVLRIERQGSISVSLLALIFESRQKGSKNIWERKYTIEEGRLCKKSNLVPVPEDEPVFILRAKDRKALATILAYCMVLDSLEQREAVMKVVEDFRRFQVDHPNEMHEPNP